MRLVALLVTMAALLALPLSASAVPCGNIGSIGCCDGTVAKYCKDGSLVEKECTTQNPPYNLCGWRADKSYYTCTDNTDADPSGTYPKECSDLPDGGIPDPDGGGSTTTYDAGPTVPCGAIPLEGCCEGATVKYCYQGNLKSKDCSDDPSCGWKDSFGYTCGTAGTADPAGTFPMPCSAYSSTGGDTGTAPTLDSGVSPTADANLNPPGPTGGDDDGCGIAAARGRPGAPALVLLVAMGLALALIRRRR